MEILKDELQEALEIVKPGLASREQVEQSTSFAFVGGNVVTYNDEISLSHPVKGLELEGAVLAENLYKFLTKVTRETIELVASDNEIVLTSGNAKAGLLLQKEIKLPLDEISEDKKWHKLPDHFIKDISFCMTACTRDLSLPILTCVHVNKEGYVEGSDNFRIARCELGQPMPINTFLLPAMSAVEVVKLKPTHVAKGRGWVHFQSENKTVISCRILNDDYPDTIPHISGEGIRVILPKTTEDILARAQVFAKREHLLDESITISLDFKAFKMESRSDTGWFKEEVVCKYKGEKMTFDITPYLLKGILAETREFAYVKDRLIFRGERWYYMSKVRMQKTKKKK